MTIIGFPIVYQIIILNYGDMMSKYKIKTLTFYMK